MPVRNWARLLAALILLTLSSRAWGEPAEQLAPAADPAFQEAIAALAEAASDAERTLALDQLIALDSPPHHRLVRQTILYSSRAGDMKSAMASGVILRHLDLSDRNLVEAVMPLLDSSDRDLVKSAASVLEGVEDRSAGRRPDFSTYRAILEDRIRAGDDLPASLVRHIYQSHPGEAVLAMMRAHRLRQPAELKEILWAEHVVSDTLWKQQYGFLEPTAVEPEAADQLARLASHTQWWARLYAAEIMRQHEAFRQLDLVQKLQDDAHELVRVAAATSADDQ